MALAMTRPTKRGDSSTFQFKRRTPQRLLDTKRGELIKFRFADGEQGQIEVTAKIGDVIKFSLRTREPDVAKLRCALASEQLERLAQAIVAGPRKLTQRQIIALAGELYRAVVADWEDEPGDILKGADPARVWKLIHEGSKGIAAADDAEFAGPFVDEMLYRKGILADSDSRRRLLLAVRDAFRDASALLVRRAEGDYSPDTTASRFPEWPANATAGTTGAGTANGATLTGLFERWRAEAERLDKSPSTIGGFGRVIRNFVALLGHDDARRVTVQDVVRFKDKRLIEDGRDPKTVQDSDLVALKAVFQHAVENGRLTANPAKDVRVKVPKKLKRRGYSDEGAIRILRAALAYERRPREQVKMAAAKRWVVWICAFTGARVGEVTQLRRKDARQQKDGVWAVTLSPEAGRMKDREEREVPLHPQLIALGFIEYVQSVSDGYLFINATGKADYRGPWEGTNNRLGEFTRSILKEERVAALHGWRHRFITLCRRHGVDSELRRKITGHAGSSVDEEHYGAVEGLYREICKLPYYDLS